MNDKDLWRLGSNTFQPPKHKGPTKSRDIPHLVKILNRLQTEYPAISAYWDRKGFLEYWLKSNSHYRTLDSFLDVQKATYAALKHSEWNQPLKDISDWPPLHAALVTVNKLSSRVIHKLVIDWIAWIHKRKNEIQDRLSWLDSLEREISKAEKSLKTARRGDKKQIRQEIADMQNQRQNFLNKVRSDYSLSKRDLNELFGVNAAEVPTTDNTPNEQEGPSYDQQQSQQQ